MEHTSISIVTLHRAKNYGAALQAYALKTFLCQEGYSASIYDSKVVSAPVTHKVKATMTRIIGHLIEKIYNRDFEEKYNKFNHFLNEYYSLNKSNDSDIYIVGSDQVWNPIIYNSDYFLQFVKKPSIKASYAASIGVSQLPRTLFQKYKDSLNDFSGISVREEQAKKALQEIFGQEKKISVNLDPIFLLSREEWIKIGKKSKINYKKNYILLYVLHIPKNINTLCKWLKNETRAEVVLIDTGYLSFFIKHDISMRNVGPEDFINLIMNASAVITTSFHGTAFSILFKKEFYSVINPHFSSRVMNLLSWSKIPAVSEKQKQFKRHDCNFEIADHVIEENRNTSRNYFEFLSEIIKHNEKQK